MKKFCVLLVTLFIFGNVFSQTNQAVDSLNQIIAATKVDTVKMNALLKLGQLFTGVDTSAGFTSCYKGLELAYKNNDAAYEVEFLLRLGKLHGNFKNNDSAIFYLTESVEKLNPQMNSYLQFETYAELGNIYWKVGDYKKSMDALLTAEKRVAPPDEASKLSRIYYIMGGVLMDLNEPEKALGYALKCIKILEDNNLEFQLAKTYSSCGGLFFMTGKHKEALEMFSKGLALAIKLNDFQSYTQATMNLGNYYNETDNLDSALYYYNLSRIRFENINKVDNLYPTLLMNIAGIFDQQKKYAEAEAAYLLADSLAGLYSFIRTKINIKKYLAQLYAHSGNWEKSYKALESYHQLKDSVTDEESNKASLELERKYNISEKEKEIALLQKDKEKQQVTKNAFIAVAVLAAIIGLILFFGFRNRGRLNKQLGEKNKLIDAERNRAIRSEQFKQQFLANMSHELRSPLNAVLGGVSLALQQNDLQASKKYLETAQRSSKNLLGIINDILDLSKIEAGKLTLEQIPFNIFEATQDVINSQSINLKSEKQQLHFKTLIDKNAKVKADPLRYMQVVTNLVNNAIKFTPAGEINVTLNYMETKNVFEIVVKDEGIGMNEEQRAGLFQTYHQTTKTTARQYGGTGLGLAITKQLVDLMDGNISVISRHNEGTTFTVELPLAITGELINEDDNASENLQQLRQLQNINLLLADDLEENRMITRDVLKSVLQGAEIKTFTNGKELIDYVHEQPDLSNTCILTDLDMPVMNGFEAVKIIRNQLKLNVPVIALTASVFIGDEEEFKAMGFDDIVIKPFVTAHLIAAISKAMKITVMQ
ncbi:MAG: ATP-binding protein [Bacteroidia bacterium]